MKNKVVVITGASSGIGAIMAREAAKKGAKVVAIARSYEKLIKLQQEVMKQGFHISILPFDVSQAKEVEKNVAEICNQNEKIDVLINNAGLGKFKTFAYTSREEIEEMMAVNVTGLMNMTKAILPVMQTQPQGHIINIASQAGKLATPKSSVYAATKHAVLGFSNALRLEVKNIGINVTTVNTGPIQTPFINRADEEGTYQKSVRAIMLQPEQVANKVIRAIEQPVREINMPKWMNIVSKFYVLAPSLIEKIGERQFRKK